MLGNSTINIINGNIINAINGNSYVSLPKGSFWEYQFMSEASQL
jgi:hypothetical protein